jgi:uncharacterized membrane protein YqjE
VIGIGTGLLLVVGAIAGVWFLRKRRQDDWEEEPEDEEETAEETGETGPPKQLSTS